MAMKMATFVLMSYYAMSGADVVVPTDWYHFIEICCKINTLFWVLYAKAEVIAWDFILKLFNAGPISGLWYFYDQTYFEVSEYKHFFLKLKKDFIKFLKSDSFGHHGSSDHHDD